MKKVISLIIVTLLVTSLSFGWKPALSANEPTGKKPDVSTFQQKQVDYLKSQVDKTNKQFNNTKGGIVTNVENVDVDSVIPQDVKETNLYKSGWIKVFIDGGGNCLSDVARLKGETISQLSSTEAEDVINALKVEHSQILTRIQSEGINIRNVKDLYTVYNGLTTEVAVGSLKALYRIFGPNRIHIAKLYRPELDYSVPLIGATTVWNSYGFNGQGMYVGVVDTGIDYAHPDFGGHPGISFPTVKVPAGYDFGDSDPNPMDCAGHGTHVSGIIAADGTVKGVAPKAKIVFAKIVSGCEGYAWETTIAEAFDYMADPNNLDDGPEGTHPPLASVNMSFGSDYGFVDPNAPDQKAIENCIAQGIVVALAAGNAYWSYYLGAPWYPDFSTVGSPSVTPSAISVGASYNTKGRYTGLTELSSSTNYAYTVGSDSPNPVTVLGNNGGQGYKYYYCGLGGSASDFPAEVVGNIALIQRGAYNFSLKIHNAAAAGAIGAIIYNSAAGGDILLTMATGGETLPSVFIGRTAGLALYAKAQNVGDGTGRVAFNAGVLVDSPLPVDTMVNFSSWGPPPDLSFKPDITAPGGGIWSTVPVAQGSYANYSGTSMASPHIAAVAALVKQAYPTATPKEIKTILMNTAKLLNDPNTGVPYVPQKQGAGRVDVAQAVYDAVNMKLSLTNLSGEPYVALGEIPDFKTTPITFKVKLTNNGDTDHTFTVSGNVERVLAYDSAMRSANNSQATFTTPNTVTVSAHNTAEVTVTIDAGNVTDWYGWPYIEGFVNFTDNSGFELHIPYLGFLGKWNEFDNRDAWSFNPVMDLPADDPWTYSELTWPLLYDAEQGNLYYAGLDFDGNYSREAIAFNPDIFSLNASTVLLRNAQNLKIEIKDSSNNVVRTVDSIDELTKMDWYWYNPYTGTPWTWDGTVWSMNSGKFERVIDGEYKLVLTATPPKIFNKQTYDAPQVIEFPVKVDTKNPVVSITGTSLNNDGTVKVSWAAEDSVPSSGIWGYLVEYSTDGWATYSDVWVPPTQNSADLQIPMTGADIFVVCFDNANNVGFKEIFYGDTVAPLITVDSPQDLGVVTSLDVSVTGSVSDNWFDYITITGDENQTVKLTSDDLGATGGDFEAPFTFTSAGSHYIDFDAYDLASNHSHIRRNFSISTPESINIVLSSPSSNPYNVYSPTFPVNVTVAGDVYSSVGVAQFTVNGDVYQLVGTSFSKNFTFNDYGNYTIQLYARDFGGNEKTLDVKIYILSSIEFPLHIPSGWALISVPFDTDVSLLSCQFVLYWDSSQWQNATILHPGVGYLVYSSASKDVNLTGTPPSSPFTEPCTGSWQLIGNPFVSPAMLSSTSTIQVILYWDGSQWQTADTNNLQPGTGYLVLTSSSGTFTFTLKP